MLDNVIGAIVANLSVRDKEKWDSRLSAHNEKQNELGVANIADQYEEESSSCGSLSAEEEKDLFCEKCDAYGHTGDDCTLDD